MLRSQRRGALRPISENSLSDSSNRWSPSRRTSPNSATASRLLSIPEHFLISCTSGGPVRCHALGTTRGRRDVRGSGSTSPWITIDGTPSVRGCAEKGSEGLWSLVVGSDGRHDPSSPTSPHTLRRREGRTCLVTLLGRKSRSQPLKPPRIVVTPTNPNHHHASFRPGSSVRQEDLQPNRRCHGTSPRSPRATR